MYICMILSVCLLVYCEDLDFKREVEILEEHVDVL
jgi:hypothetical protein